MNTAPLAPDRELIARLAAFTALATLVTWQSTRVVADPAGWRITLAVATLIAGATVLALIGTARLRRAPRWALAVLASLATAALGLVAIGVPADMLTPGSWERLAHQVGRGFAGLDGRIEYPYAGKNEWSRLVLLAGVMLGLTLAASLAFWPSTRARRRRRTLALVIMIAVYAIAASAVEPSQPLLWGLLLFALVAAWLWLPGLGRRDAVPAAALVAVAGLLAMAAGHVLDAERPWIDYSDWQLAGNEGGSTFDWDHTYGPLDWPRDADALLAVDSDQPHYWKASVLDEFDGTRWLNAGDTVGERLEVPTQVEGGRSEVDPKALNEEWVEEVSIEFGALRSELVVAPGTLIGVDGIEEVIQRPDGTTVVDDDPLQDGDAYSALAYVPEPSPERMRAATGRYPPALEPYTELRVALGEIGDSGAVLVDDVDVPLRASPVTAGARREARRQILASPYARVYRLARRITAGQPTPYGAATAIEAHLRSGRYEYAEAIPKARRHPLDEFLFEDRRGYCQQFSGAMALMLRMVGIPSRVATGFSAGFKDPDANDRFVVSDVDAHSWVEVYLTGIGWVPFDPTPAVAPAASQVGEGDFADAASGQGGREQPAPSPGRSAGTSESASSSDSGEIWTIVLAGFGILGVGMAIPSAARARRYRLLSAAEAADAQLHELRTGLGRLDLPVGPRETLLSLEGRLRRRLGPATATYVAKLRKGRFERGDLAPPTMAERRAVRRELRSSRWGSNGRLRVAFAFPLGGPKRKPRAP
jgi:transglutaminase-like putative cysteine protease